MPIIIEYLKYASLSAAAYVRMGTEPLLGERFAIIANDQKRLPLSLGLQLFAPPEQSSNQYPWSIRHYFGGDVPGVTDDFGFAATLFERTGEKVLAVRGTDDTFGPDMILNSFAGIGVLGMALPQAVAMVNLIQRLKGETGAPVMQLRAHASLTDPGVPSVQAAGVLGSTVYLYFSFDTATGLGLLGPSDKLTVTGHSLGGHLALLAARLFPDIVNPDLYVYNSSGIDPTTITLAPDLVAQAISVVLGSVLGSAALNLAATPQQLSAQLISLIGSFLSEPAADNFSGFVIHNLQSEDLPPVNDSSLVASVFTGAQHLGPAIDVPTEANSHVIEPSMDALALHALLSAIDANIAFSDIVPILQASSHELPRSEERLTESLHRLFRGGETNLPSGGRELPMSDAIGPIDNFLWLGKGEMGAREAFHSAVLALQGNVEATTGPLTVNSLVGSSTDELTVRATGDNGIAYRYALKDLNPFAVLGTDALYAIHNVVGDLNLYDRTASARGGMTDQYISDRASFLSAKNEANVSDVQSVYLPSQPDNWDYVDLPQNYRVVAFGEAPASIKRRAAFGGNAADALRGEMWADRLYAGNGQDLLDGKAGDDYFEGGAGLDIYEYNASSSAFGNTNDGADTIRDTDGRGVLRYVYRQGTLSTTTSSTFITDASVKVSDTEWRNADGRFSYTLLTGNPGQSDLVVTITADAGGSMTLKDFRDGDFGIWLNSPQPRSFADTTDTLLGTDLNESLAGTADHNLVLAFAGNDTVRAGAGDDSVEGGDGADMLYGEDGGDRLYGDAGRDSVYGGAGDDELHGGIDADIVEGEAGADLLAGEEGGDVVAGGADDDEVHSGDVAPLATALLLAESETPTGLKGEWVDGGEGDDTVIAGAGNDQVMGGGGADLLVGGAGDDNLVGDASRTLVHIDNWMVTRQTIVSGGSTNYQLVYNADAQVADSANGAGDHIYGGGGVDWVLGGPGDDLIEAGSGDDVAFGEAGADALSGGDGNDVLIGDNPGVVPATDEGGDVLDGGAGDDQVYGNGGDDVLFGGPGRDTLIGGAGKDLYVIEKGGGEDTIFDVASGASDPEASVLVLGEGITRDAIRFRTGSLLVDLGDGDAVHVEGFDPLDPASTPVLGAIQFADGTSLSYAEVLAQGFDIDGTGEDDDGHDAAHPVLIGTGVTDRIRGLGGNDLVAGLAGDDVLDGDAGDDQLQGGDGNDALRGGEGADVLFGQGGDDALSGDPGNDTLVGETGNDVYQFARGDGQDVVYEQDATAGNLDRLEFAADVAPGDIDATRDPAYSGNLLLTLRGTGDSVTLANHFLGPDEQVEEIRFSDGTLWTPATTPLLIRGTASADALYGTSGTDLIEGLGGNDELVGRESDDRYFIARGDGQDTIADLDATPGNTDRLIYSADILPGEIRASRSGNDLVLALAGTTDRVTVTNYLENEGATAYALERIEFPADGTVWDLEAVKTLVIAPTEGNDTILGYASDDLLPGLGGNDVIRGGGGDDTLDGGAGADSLYGEAGSDTYLFDRGSGQDMIRNLDSDPADTTDVLQFSAAIAPADLLRGKSGNDLVLTVAGTADEVRLDEYFSGGTALIEQIAFADGTVWTEQTIAGFFPTTGTSGNDLLQGTGLSETISGFAGADTIRGANGHDTLDGGLGVDHLYGEWGNDLLIAGTGEPKRGGATSNYLYGGPGDDVLVSSGKRDYFYGEAGNDIYLGGAEPEWMEDTGGNNLFYGGGSNDHIWPGDQNDIVMRIYSVDGDRDYDGVRGRDVILLNKSDSGSAVNLGMGSTISLGGGVLYKDLVLVTQNNALYLKWGNKQIGLDWYGDSFIPPNKAVTQLQIVIEGTRDYNAASQNPMNNRKIQVFDFLGLAAAFDAARAAGQNFSVAANLPQFRLWGSDSEAIGGAVAYQYARTGSVGALTYDQMRAVIGDAAFAVSAQPIVAAAPLAAESAAATDEIAMVQAMPIADSGDTATATATLPSTVSIPAEADTQGGWRLAELPDEWFAPEPIHESARSAAVAWRRIARELPAHLDHSAAWDGVPPFANGVRVTPSNAMGVRVTSDTGVGLSDAAAPRLRQFEGLREGLALLA